MQKSTSTDISVKHLKSTKSGLLILVGAAVIAMSAQLPLNVPLLDTNIPGTWQTFAVLVFAYANRASISIAAVLLYLVLGLLGLPVFADGASGYSAITGNTGGYLYGFVLGAAISTIIATRFPTRNFIIALLAMTIGTLAILLSGVLHLSASIGLTNALKYGFYPFIYGALIKVILGAAVFPLYRFFTQLSQPTP